MSMQGGKYIAFERGAFDPKRGVFSNEVRRVAVARNRVERLASLMSRVGPSTPASSTSDTSRREVRR